MHTLMTSLQRYDPQVFNTLVDQSMKPEFFAFRWLTLLLSQEFQLPGKDEAGFPGLIQTNMSNPLICPGVVVTSTKSPLVTGWHIECQIH